jgi:hypothetical protein
MLLSNTNLYRFNLAFALIIILDISNRGHSITLDVAIKYVYTFVMLAFIFLYFFQFRTVDWTSISPLLALLFFVIAISVWAINWAVYDNKLSYASAFTSSLLFACAAFVPAGAFRLDPNRILNHLLIIFTVASLSYMLEVIHDKTGSTVAHYANYGQNSYFDDLHIKSAVSILGLCIAILKKRWLIMAVILAAMGITQVLRPSSTLILATAVCLPLTFALMNLGTFVSRIIVNAVVLISLLSPFALFLYSDEVGTAVAAVESTVKSGWLGGQANTEFRLALYKEAFRSLEDTSFIFGNGLNGNQTVSLEREFPASHGIPIPLHSDLLVIMTQAGLVGYFLFATMIFSMINVRFRLMRHPRDTPEGLYALGAISIVSIVCLLIHCSANPYLNYYEYALPFWIILFVSEIARKAHIVHRNISSVRRPRWIRRKLVPKGAA